MKKRIFSTLAVALFFATASFAQLEVKVNPIGLLFGGISASGEYIVSDNIGVEVIARLASRSLSFGVEDSKLTGFGGTGLFKYYFSPEKGGDKFYAGAYLKYAGLSGKYTGSASGVDETANWNKFAVGFAVGYKWVADSGLLFEFGTGVGRNISSNWTFSDGDESYSFNFPVDFMLRVSVGYRFNY